MKNIFEKINHFGGKAYFVGGCVRDEFLGVKNKDVDIEVFGIDIKTLIEILKEFGKTNAVGESFGVIKLTTEDNDYDFSLPRRDNKIGKGHKDFEVVVDHTMTIEDAAKRRDFTFNAISKDEEEKIIDPFGGISDLQNKKLKHTSDHFSEDPLRVLRGFQFCGRFDLIADFSTILLCRKIKEEFNNISKDRLFEEFKKWALKSKNHKAGLDLLVMSHWIDNFPELKNILGVPQELEFHPEGCVYTHTCYVVNAMNEICERENIVGDRKLILILSALCHDLGKAETTIYRKGRISAPLHDKVGGPLTEKFLNSIKCPKYIVERVIPLVEHHMDHLNDISPKMVNKLSVKLRKANISDLVLLIEADHSGRPPKEKRMPEKAKQMIEIARKLGVDKNPPKRIIEGKDIIDIIPPGEDMGLILKYLYQKQLECKFSDKEGGFRLMKKHHIYHKHKRSKD